jgi:mRNA interferase MazF
MSKDFDSWNIIKKDTDAENHVPLFREREIWYFSIGENIGHEQCGGKQFTRPVLIVRKFNPRLFWGVPLTTKTKDTRHYYGFEFKGLEQSAMLTQLRLWDANRLLRRMGKLPSNDFKQIRTDLANYLK